MQALTRAASMSITDASMRSKRGGLAGFSLLLTYTDVNNPWRQFA